MALKIGMRISVLHEQPKVVRTFLSYLLKAWVAVLSNDGFQYRLVASKIGVFYVVQSPPQAIWLLVNHLLHRPLVNVGQAIQRFA